MNRKTCTYFKLTWEINYCLFFDVVVRDRSLFSKHIPSKMRRCSPAHWHKTRNTVSYDLSCDWIFLLRGIIRLSHGRTLRLPIVSLPVTLSRIPKWGVGLDLTRKMNDCALVDFVVKKIILILQLFL